MEKRRPRGLIHNLAYDQSTGCWNWTGKIDNSGYGRLILKKKNVSVHRLSASLWLGLRLDSPSWVLHKCDNRKCFNPKHLFIGTPKDNQIDSVNKKRHWQTKKTKCKHGHDFSGENLIIRTRFYCGRLRKERVCKECAGYTLPPSLLT
jgi:hypothetical protein